MRFTAGGVFQNDENATNCSYSQSNLTYIVLFRAVLLLAFVKCELCLHASVATSILRACDF